MKRKWINTLMMYPLFGRDARAMMATIMRQMDIDRSVKQIKIPRNSDRYGTEAYTYVSHFELYSALEVYEHYTSGSKGRWYPTHMKYVDILNKLKEHYED